MTWTELGWTFNWIFWTSQHILFKNIAQSWALQKCKDSSRHGLCSRRMVNIFGKPLHPTHIKLLENKAIYNLVLNHVVVFTIIARDDLRKNRSEPAFIVGDFMGGPQLEVWLGKERGGDFLEGNSLSRSTKHHWTWPIRWPQGGGWTWLEERRREMIEKLEVSGSRAQWGLSRGLANCHLTHSQFPFGATSRKWQLHILPFTHLQVIFSNHNFNFVSFRLHLLLFRTKSIQVWHRKGRCG